MIYFITNNKEKYSKLINTNIFSDIRILDEAEGKLLYFKKSAHNRNAYVDVETNGLDPYVNKLLLTGIMYKTRRKEYFFMFDWTCDISDIVEDLTKHYVIGHNLKFDIKFLRTNSNHLIKNVYDTMIAEQRIWMGSGYKFGLDEVAERYTKTIMLKSTRDEFVGANTDSFKINTNHLYYLRGDLKHLPVIKKKQQRLIHKFKMEFLIYGIENPLIAVTANAELIGFHLNKQKWLDRVKDDIEKKYEILLKLDGIVDNLKNTLPDVKKDLLVGGKWTKKRIRNKLADKVNTNGTVNIPNLFGEVSSAIDLFRKGNSKKIVQAIPKVKEYVDCVDYTKAEVIHIFAALNQPAITEHELFSVPKINSKGKVENFNYYTIDSKILERYLIIKPNTPMKEFLETFSKLQSINKSLSTYGKSFIDKINPVTNRLHTEFRQCQADTGRYQSGGGKKSPDKPNFQNIPRNKEMRQSFEAGKGYLVNTADYSGAELMVMASHAQDERLIQLDKEDMHSYLATHSWRDIYKFRANKSFALLRDPNLIEGDKDFFRKEYEVLLDKAHNFTVSKTEPVGFRQAFKPMGFGVVYGVYAKKAGKTLNISTEEGALVIKRIEREIPKTIAFVKSVSVFAAKNGYVLHNTRTNSRRWFPFLIKQLKGEITKETNFLDISGEESAARNSSIQGTQADFVKEASVKLQYYYWKKKIDADILSWVHDEIVDRMEESIAEETSEIKHKIMVDTANKYLRNVHIDCEMQLLPYWTK